MANWMIPCNPKYFDVFGAYSKLKTIDWNQSVISIAVGDIVYIYVGKPVQAIMFKTRVIATGITCDEVDRSDEEFNLDDNQGQVEQDINKRWMRLELVKRYASRDLSLSMLGQYGMKGNIQGPRRVDQGIQTLIDLVDPQDSDPTQPTAATPGTTQPLIIRTDTEQTAVDQPLIPSADSVGRRREKRITIGDREYIIYGVGAAPDGNRYPHMVDAQTGLTPRGNQCELMKQYLISRGVTPTRSANTHWYCNAILKLNDAASPDPPVDMLSSGDALKPAAFSESSKQKSIADLKQLSYDDLRALFIRWCQNSGFSPSTYMAFVSDSFYLWRKEDPAQFWLAVESDDAITYNMLYQSLKKNSSGEADKNAPGYARAIRRFRQFVAAWLKGEEIDISNGTATPAPPNPIQASVGLAAPSGDSKPIYSEKHSPPMKIPEISSRLEKKLDSIIGAIATMYSGKSTAAEPEKPKEKEQDRRFRLEWTPGGTPLLMVRKPTPITGLIFTLRLYGIGLDDNSEQYRIFFTNSCGEQLSETQVIEVTAGGEYNRKFELKSSASEEKTIYLAVQSINAAANEARQLIEFPVKIAFAADFGL